MQVARCVDDLAFFELRCDLVSLRLPAKQLDPASGAGLHQLEDDAAREDVAECHANSRPGLKISILVFHFRLPVRHGAANPREPQAPTLRARLTPTAAAQCVDLWNDRNRKRRYLRANRQGINTDSKLTKAHYHRKMTV